jgi:hypothetical protein
MANEIVFEGLALRGVGYRRRRVYSWRQGHDRQAAATHVTNGAGCGRSTGCRGLRPHFTVRLSTVTANAFPGALRVAMPCLDPLRHTRTALTPGLVRASRLVEQFVASTAGSKG